MPVTPGKRRSRVPLEQRRRARRLVLQALYQWLMADAEPLDIAAQFHADTHGKVDWDFFDAIFLDIPRQVDSLKEYLQPHLDRDLKSLDPIERALLYQGAYELAFRIDVPYRVVINEYVELAKTFGATDGHKYINGVLDKLVPTLRSAERPAN
ncbi:MAG: transcription antitermination factor NusB [Pseudohongiellaceae bacterium]